MNVNSIVCKGSSKHSSAFLYSAEIYNYERQENRIR